MMMRTAFFLAAATAVVGTNIAKELEERNNILEDDAPMDDIDCTSACTAGGDNQATCEWKNDAPVCMCSEDKYDPKFFCFEKTVDEDEVVRAIITFNWEETPCEADVRTQLEETIKGSVDDVAEGEVSIAWTCGSLHATVSFGTAIKNATAAVETLTEDVKAKSKDLMIETPTQVVTVNVPPCVAENAKVSAVVNNTCYAVSCKDGYSKEDELLATPCVMITPAPTTEETTAPGTPAPASDDDDGLSKSAIAGIVIGCVIGVALIAAAVVFFVTKGGAAAAPVDNEPVVEQETAGEEAGDVNV